MSNSAAKEKCFAFFQIFGIFPSTTQICAEKQRFEVSFCKLIFKSISSRVIFFRNFGIPRIIFANFKDQDKVTACKRHSLLKEPEVLWESNHIIFAYEFCLACFPALVKPLFPNFKRFEWVYEIDNAARKITYN